MTTIDKLPDPLRKKFFSARTIILNRYPYLAPLILRLPVLFDEKNPTALVTKKGVIVFGTKGLEQLTVAQFVGRYLHEASHWMWLHYARVGGRDPKRWNLAGDLVINETWKRAGEQYPPTWVFPEHVGLAPFGDSIPSVEAVYDMLPEGSGAQDANCGSGAGNKQDGEDEVPEDMEPEGGSESTRDAVDMASEAIVQGLKSRGVKSADMDLWASSTARKPKTDPLGAIRAIVGRAFVAAKGRMSEPVWTKINRRGWDHLPGRQTYTPEVTVIVDGSGSMCNEMDGNHVLSQIWNVLNKLGRCRVIVNDTAVSFDGHVKSIPEFRKSMKGGGGTELTPAFEAAYDGNGAAKGPVLVLTDGCLGRPNHPGVDKALWVVTRKEYVQPWMTQKVVLES